MKRSTNVSWRQVWSLAMALVVALTVIGAAPEFAAAEKKRDIVEERDRFEAACLDAGGFSYGSDSSNFGCYLEDVTIECNHSMVVLYGWSSCERVMDFEPDEVGTPANLDGQAAGTATTVWTADVAVADERTLAPGTDVGNPVRDARVIAPATGVWIARGLTADDQTVRDHRADGAGTIQDPGAANESADPLAPEDAEAAAAALAVGEDPINSDFDEFKRFCEHTGGRVERTGDNTWVCRGGWWWGSCDLTPGPDYDCLSPRAPYSTRPDVDTTPMTTAEVLSVSAPDAGQIAPGTEAEQSVVVVEPDDQSAAAEAGAGIQSPEGDEEVDEAAAERS